MIFLKIKDLEISISLSEGIKQLSKSRFFFSQKKACYFLSTPIHFVHELNFTLGNTIGKVHNLFFNKLPFKLFLKMLHYIYCLTEFITQLQVRMHWVTGLALEFPTADFNLINSSGFSFWSLTFSSSFTSLLWFQGFILNLI